ncbi:nSTAND1 domain-containing NTPase [Nostoc sp.]|uniref:nSTAND1 domain-containing NTPase n=1 Tax=Nostoc sp. TaxID=1180 RepID=UPI002FF707B2
MKNIIFSRVQLLKEHPLGKLVDIFTRQQQQNKPHLLFIDQFEEVFTLCQDDEGF